MWMWMLNGIMCEKRIRMVVSPSPDVTRELMQSEIHVGHADDDGMVGSARVAFWAHG